MEEGKILPLLEQKWTTEKCFGRYGMIEDRL